MLVTLFAIICTWYATKVYYSKTTLVKVSKFDSKDLIHAKCSKCTIIATVHKEQLRVPFYCSSCK